jgi:hypothetical protein
MAAQQQFLLRLQSLYQEKISFNYTYESSLLSSAILRYAP